MNIKANEIEIVSVGSLVPHPKNMNQHSNDQIERLCKLIEYQGFRNPLVVQKGTNIIVAGHGRLMAALKLGIEKVPVTYQEFESDAQLYAYMASDNAIASWAELDLGMVNSEMLDLGPDFDVDLFGIKDFVIDPMDGAFPELSGAEPDCQQVTFVLSNEQKDIVDEAIKKAKLEEDCTDGINTNSNGNALAALVKRYVYG